MNFLTSMAATTLFSVSLMSVANAAPLLRIFELGIQDNQQQAFNLAGQENLTASVSTEPGVLAMYAVSPVDKQNLSYLFEIYQDRNAYEAHVASPHFKAYQAKAPSLLTEHKKLTETEAQFFAEKAAPLWVINGSDKPVMRYAEITLKNGVNEQLRQIVIDEMKAAMEKEDGVLAMYAATVKGHPEQWRFVEIYADDAAYEFHRQTPHFQHYIQATADMLQDKKLTVLTNRSLVNKGGLYFNVLD